MATTTRITLEEFLALPETETASEFVDGEVIERGMPTGLHALIQGLLSVILGQFVTRNRLGLAGPEWRCVFGPPERRQARVPDYAFIRSDRLPRGLGWLNGPFYGPPDLAIEVLSPDDRPSRVSNKIVFYLQNGVRMVWLIDPVERAISVFTPNSQRILRAGDMLDGGDVVPGFSAPVDDLFPSLDAP